VNIQKIYALATSGEKLEDQKPDPNEEALKNDIKVWLNEPMTKLFLEALEQRQEQNLGMAMTIAPTNPQDPCIVANLSEANTITKILHYARNRKW